MIKNIEEVSCGFLYQIDLVCFSHLRWGFVFQRPNHLLSRFSRHQRVFFIEEPIFTEGDEKLHIENFNENLFVVTPHIKAGLPEKEVLNRQQKFVDRLFSNMNVRRFFSWYYTPMALPFTNHLTPELVIYDCMDELSAFKFAPPQLTKLEKQLFAKADIVFVVNIPLEFLLKVQVADLRENVEFVGAAANGYIIIVIAENERGIGK